MIKMLKFVLRALTVLLIGIASAAIGLIIGSIIGGNLAAANITNFDFLGQEGYEAGGLLGFYLGALLGLVGGGVALFGRQATK